MTKQSGESGNNYKLALYRRTQAILGRIFEPLCPVPLCPVPLCPVPLCPVPPPHEDVNLGSGNAVGSPRCFVFRSEGVDWDSISTVPDSRKEPGRPHSSQNQLERLPALRKKREGWSTRLACNLYEHRSRKNEISKP